MALEKAALVVTRLSMVAFFWMDALVRLSSDVAICCACSSSAAWLAPKVVSPVVMRGDVAHLGERSRPVDLSVRPCSVLICWAELPFSPAKHHVAAGERVFGSGSSEIGTPASSAKTWHFSCLRM